MVPEKSRSTAPHQPGSRRGLLLSRYENRVEMKSHYSNLIRIYTRRNHSEDKGEASKTAKSAIGVKKGPKRHMDHSMLRFGNGLFRSENVCQQRECASKSLKKLRFNQLPLPVTCDASASSPLLFFDIGHTLKSIARKDKSSHIKIKGYLLAKDYRLTRLQPEQPNIPYFQTFSSSLQEGVKKTTSSYLLSLSYPIKMKKKLSPVENHQDIYCEYKKARKGSPTPLVQVRRLSLGGPHRLV